MTTDSLNDWSPTVAANTNIAGTSIALGCAPQDVGVFMRTAMAQIAYAVQGTGGAPPATWHSDDLVNAGVRFRFGSGSTSAGSGTVTFTAFPNTVLGAVATAQINGPSGSGIMTMGGSPTTSTVVFHSIDTGGTPTSVNFFYVVWGF